LFEVAGGDAVVLVGGGNVTALSAATGAARWAWAPGDAIVAAMAAPGAGAGGDDAVVVLHNAGFWTTDELTVVSAATGAPTSTATRSSCTSVGASAAATGGGVFGVYSVAVCWSPPAGATAGVTPPPPAPPVRNGYPVWALVDEVRGGTIAPAGAGVELSGGDYAGTLAGGVPIGPGARAWWAYTSFNPLEIGA
jgi:hypothetical protein